jgi:putative tributyrin esterase
MKIGNSLLKRSIHWMLLFFVFGGITTSTAEAQRTWIADSLNSVSTGDVRNIRIILPSDSSPDTRYPVLYLLHGYGGDHRNWTERTKILEYLDSLRLDLVVVMPDGDNSWYQNMINGQKFTDFMVDELPKWLYDSHPVDTSTQYIAGLSMGGYGALYLGMSHPQKYRAIGSFSGAVVFPSILPTATSELEGRTSALSLFDAFGDGSHPNRSTGDVYRYAAMADLPNKPYIFLRHGIQDAFTDFLPGHRKLTELLAKSQWPYEYHETPGAHNWPFWDASIREYLNRLIALQQPRR